MKTVHLTNAWHSSSGGVRTFYRALMDTANNMQRSVVLIVPGAENRVDSYGDYCRIYSVSAPKSPFDQNYRCIMPWTFLGSRSRIATILRDEKPDLVEICDKYSLQYVGGLLRIGWLSGVNVRPTVIGLSCERLDENISAYVSKAAFLRRLCGPYMKWLYFPMADHHIAVTGHTASELRDASRGHKVRRGVWVAPMGVDLVTFSPNRRAHSIRAGLLRVAGANSNSILALYVGRLAPEKNLNLLIRMMCELAGGGHGDFHLLIAGDGPLRASLEADAMSACPGRVHFLGNLGERNGLADLYANCDVFVHANPREPFGIAPLEAMASGLALIAPQTGGVRTYASVENAWLVPDDPKAYAHAVLEATTADTGSKRVVRALETSRKYSWPVICHRYFRLYEEIHEYRVSGRNTS